jgi:hypothetical protein
MEEKIPQEEGPLAIFGIYESTSLIRMFTMHKPNTRETMSITSYPGDMDLHFIFLRTGKTQ